MCLLMTLPNLTVATNGAGVNQLTVSLCVCLQVKDTPSDQSKAEKPANHSFPFFPQFPPRQSSLGVKPL